MPISKLLIKGVSKLEKYPAKAVSGLKGKSGLITAKGRFFPIKKSGTSLLVFIE